MLPCPPQAELISVAPKLLQRNQPAPKATVLSADCLLGRATQTLVQYEGIQISMHGTTEQKAE